MSGPVHVPTDLNLVPDDELRTLATQVGEAFDALRASDDVTPESLAEMTELADHHDRIQAELTGREARAAAESRRQQQALSEQRDRLVAHVRGPAEPNGDGGGGTSMDAAAIAQAAAEGTAAALVAALASPDGGPRRRGDLSGLAERATASLSTAQRHAPPATPPNSQQLAVTAGVDIPGVARGGDLTTMDAVVDAIIRRARSTPITTSGIVDGGAPAVTIRNQFEHTIDDRTPPSQVEELLKFITRRELAEALVAGGGWCAPSEIRYDFFNIADTDGMVDLPTLGISRGGIRFPVSPSLADVFFSSPASGFGGFSVAFNNANVPWLWTEDDDRLTVTGSTNKPTLRVPCPSFSEERLECYGITVTAGNLADDAYPEATRNFLSLMVAAHAHAMNGRILALMSAKSSAAVTGGDYGTATNPVYQQVMGGLSLAATDYRARYGMRTDAILEAVIPYWVQAAIQADLTWRTGTDELLSVTLAEINGYLADRGIRAQWVNDWQVRASGQFGHSTAMTNWPTTVDVLLYAAGTFVLGNGLSLDLGVVRDSVLNAENDHTAAWSEECHLVAKVGHESRKYTITFNVNGATNMTTPATPPFL